MGEMKRTCETCRYGSTLRGEVAHCALTKKTARLPYVCKCYAAEPTYRPDDKPIKYKPTNNKQTPKNLQQ